MGDNLVMKLPEGFRQEFMQQVVSRTSPEDACRLSCVSKTFRSVADSNVVWDSFILPDHRQQLSTSGLFTCYNSSKELFMLLTFFPANFRQGDGDDDESGRSDRWSGKRWLELPNRHSKLSITYLDTDYWKFMPWIPKLGHVVWLEIKGKVSTRKLSANTTYTAYLVFALSKEFNYGFHIPVEASVWITEEESIKKFVYLDPAIAKSQCQYLKLRDDHRLEVELGDYLHNDGENRDLEMIVREVNSGKPKCGMLIYSMELRPKRDYSINHNCNSHHQVHSYTERGIVRKEGELSKEGEEDSEDTDLFSKLPEEFAHAFMQGIVSHTTPVDACRLSVVAKSFRSAAEADVVWERFLPTIISNFWSADSHLNISFASKKDLYLFLIGNPLLIDANTKSFWLDKWSGKKCFMITTSFIKQDHDINGYWVRENNHSSRFVETFRSYYLTWFEIHGKMSTSMLSPDTTYTAYLVHKSESREGHNFPLENPIPFEASVGSSGDESMKRVVYLDRKNGETDNQYGVERKDGWLEVELGEYFNKGGENKDLEMSVMEVTSEIIKGGYLIQGIEIRPKHGLI